MPAPRRPRSSRKRGAPASDGLPEIPLTTADRIGAPEQRQREAPLPNPPDLERLLQAVQGSLSGGLDAGAFAAAWGDY
jgi:hypothetical protein